MTISTHILDLAQGRPRAGVQVRLERQDGGAGDGGDGDGWVAVAVGVTDSEGRLRDWTPTPLEPGRYRLVFVTAGQFFPEIPVVFELPDGVGHLHIPLLLNEFGYTTYRGS